MSDVHDLKSTSGPREGTRDTTSECSVAARPANRVGSAFTRGGISDALEVSIGCSHHEKETPTSERIAIPFVAATSTVVVSFLGGDEVWTFGWQINTSLLSFDPSRTETRLGQKLSERCG